jgi:DNA-binding NarL/FixJ family response regulator
MTTPTIGVLLLDRYPLLRTGLRLIIESRPGLQVLHEDVPDADLTSLIKHKRPDVVLLSVVHSGQLELLADLARQGLKVIVISGEQENRIHHEAVRLGVTGLVMKEQPAATLLKAIEKVHVGEVWLSRAVMATVLNNMLSPPEAPGQVEAAVASLTERELEVIQELSLGLKNQEVADRLQISESTVRHHLTSVYSKLNVPDRLSLLIFAYQHKLVTLPD